MIRLNRETGGDDTLEPMPKFDVGQLVRHRRYGYRGVVVAYDTMCRANDEWYYSNKTQPNRNQPWYHVLVHGTASTTYAAETSLKPDSSGEEIHHPLVAKFFANLSMAATSEMLVLGPGKRNDTLQLRDSSGIRYRGSKP